MVGTFPQAKRSGATESFAPEKPRRFGMPNLFASGNYFLLSLTHILFISLDFWCVRKRLYVCRYWVTSRKDLRPLDCYESLNANLRLVLLTRVSEQLSAA